MTDTPFIRAAKAIWKKRGINPDDLCSNGGREMVPLWKTSLFDAKAVLEAVREPSLQMNVAGNDAYDDNAFSPDAIWQAMIDAALSE